MHRTYVKGLGMCTLPEMSGTECFVLVGVVHSCTRAAALLVQGAALQDLSGHALPCSTPCSLNSFWYDFCCKALHASFDNRH